MGIANLPLRPDMFTAMDGGIVFSRGGAVQRFNGRYDSLISPEFGGITPGLEELDTLRVEETKRKKDKEQYEFLKDVSPVVAARFAEENPSVLKTKPAPAIKTPDKKSEDKSPDTKKGSASTNTKTNAGASSAGIKSVFDQFMNRVAPYNVESDASKELRTGILGGIGRIREAYDKSELTPEKIKEIEDAEKLLRQTEYDEYTKGRQERAEKIRAALEGEAPTFQQRIARGLANIPADMRGMRLGQGLAMLGAGAGQADADYEKRRRDAAKYIADTQELAAQRDLAERRGDRVAARELTDKENARLKSRFETARGFESAQMQGLGSLLGDTRTVEGRRADLAAKGAGLELQTELQKQLEAARAARDANKPTELVRNVQEIAKLMGVSEREAFALLKPVKSDQKRADPARALETVRAIPFNDPMLISRAGLTADEKMKLSRSKTLAELPPNIQTKLNRAYETIFEQLTTGAADASRYE